MADTESPHLRLQQQIDCQLEIKPLEALKAWESEGWKELPGTDADEAPLKYMALAILEAIEERAVRLSLDKDQGVTVFADKTYTIPKAPPGIRSLADWKFSGRSPVSRFQRDRESSPWGYGMTVWNSSFRNRGAPTLSIYPACEINGIPQSRGRGKGEAGRTFSHKRPPEHQNG